VYTPIRKLCFHSIEKVLKFIPLEHRSTFPQKPKPKDKMVELRPRYSKEEFARRGDAIYENDIRPNLKPDDMGKFVLIDIETGAYEIDTDEIAASDRLLARYPEAQVWMVRAGYRHVHRI
jgi:hypothetical protein